MFSYERMCSLTRECLLLRENVFSYERMCSLRENVFSYYRTGKLYVLVLSGIQEALMRH